MGTQTCWLAATHFAWVLLPFTTLYWLQAAIQEQWNHALYSETFSGGHILSESSCLRRLVGCRKFSVESNVARSISISSILGHFPWMCIAQSTHRFDEPHALWTTAELAIRMHKAWHVDMPSAFTATQYAGLVRHAWRDSGCFVCLVMHGHARAQCCLPWQEALLMIGQCASPYA